MSKNKTSQKLQMKKNKRLDNQIAFYETPDGSVNVEVLYAEGELEMSATCKEFLQVQKEE